MTPAQDATSGAVPGYRETMPVPIAIWTVTLSLWALFAVAMGLTLGPWAGVPLLAVGGVGLVIGLHKARGQVAVGEGGLSAGRATLPLAVAGPTTTLDSAAARVLRGTGADSRAFLYLRSWVGTAIRVDVADPTDPTPYWYVSTRHPEELAAAVEAGRPAPGSKPV